MIPGLDTGGGGLSNETTATSGSNGSAGGDGANRLGFDVGNLTFGDKPFKPTWQHAALAGVAVLGLAVVAKAFAGSGRRRRGEK